MSTTGTVLALTTAPSYGADLIRHQSIALIEGVGIEGDRHAGNRRAVTIVCTGELAKAAADHGVEGIDGVATRRNIVVDLPSLPRSHGDRFTVGEVEFEVWRDCAPCNRPNPAFPKGREYRELSHWLIPRRANVPDVTKNSRWNIKPLWGTDHALADPFRYQFMPRWWKAQNPAPNAVTQFWIRTPNYARGLAAAGVVGAVGYGGKTYY